MGTDNDVGYRETADTANIVMQKGLKVLGVELINLNTTDFAPIATKINSMKPDAVFFPGVPNKLFGLCLHQAKELGSKWVPIIMAIEPDRLKEMCTKEDMEGLLGVGVILEGPEASEEAKAWAAKFRKKFNNELNEFAPGYVMGMRAMIKALETTKSLNFDDLVQAVENVGKIPVIDGYAVWGAANRAGLPHQALYPTVIQEYKNGTIRKAAIVSPFDLPAEFKSLKELGLR